MKKAIVSFGAAALLAVAAPAQADRIPVQEGDDHSPCVKYAEYQLIHFGMHRGEVRRTFDTDGHRISRTMMDSLAGQVSVAPGDEVARPKRLMDRSYPVCIDELSPHGGSVYVEFNLRTGRATAFAWI